jgi:hypothetical protein
MVVIDTQPRRKFLLWSQHRSDDRVLLSRRHQKLNSRVSVVKQKNADNGMTLKFVKYLHRSALECSLAQLRRKMPGVLFLNATVRDQRTDTDCPGPVRFHVGAISLKRQRTPPQLDRAGLECDRVARLEQ